MSFRDYSTSPAANTQLGDGTYIGPNMLRNKVRPALQQIAADGKELADEMAEVLAEAQEIVNTTPLTVTSATGQTVSTRGLLAGIVAPVNGQVAHLTEGVPAATGRMGTFDFDDSDLSAEVTADPDQAMLVAPASDTTGASGAWRRRVHDSVFHLPWWGVAPSPTVETAKIQRAITATPTGATLKFPPYTVRCVLGVFDRGDITLDGYGPELSYLEYDPAGSAGFMLWLYGSNAHVRNLKIGGFNDASTANSPACLVFGNNDTSAAQTENYSVENCEFVGGRIGLQVGANVSGPGGSLTRARKVRVRNCRFYNYRHALSLFGAEDVDVSGCTYVMQADTLITSSCLVRVLGSKDVSIADCSGSGEGHRGIILDVANRNGVRIANENIEIDDVHFTGCDLGAVVVGEGLGEISIRNSTISGEALSGTSDYTAIYFTGGFAAVVGLLPEVGHFEAANCKFVGYSIGVQEAGVVRSLATPGTTFVANSSSSAFPARACGVFAGGCSLAIFKDTKFIMPAMAGRFRYAATAGATNKIIIKDCLLPEGAGTVVSDLSTLIRSPRTETLISRAGRTRSISPRCVHSAVH